MKRRFLLDSGAVEQWMRPGSLADIRAERAKATGGILGYCIPVFGEMIAGIEGSDSREKNMSRFERASPGLVLWPYDKAAAREFGKLFAYLRKIGRPMQQIDIQIAAIALTLGQTTVVSGDSDFTAVPGLSVENWSLPEPSP